MKNIRIIILTIMCAFLALMLSCSSQKKKLEENIIGNYVIVDSFKLESPVLWYGTGREINNQLLAVNLQEYRLELISKSGKLLSHCGRHGSGPGEFTNPELFDCSNNMIYLIDSGNNKIVIIELDAQKEKLIYRDEFHLNFRPRDICAIGNDKMIISAGGQVNNMKLYDIHGVLLKEFSIPYSRHTQTDEDILFSDCLVENCGEKHVLIGSIIDMKLYFCDFDHNTISLQQVGEENVKFRRRSKGIVDAGKNGINIFGISKIICAHGNYYISFRSDMPDMKKIGETFFEVYNKTGIYVGNVFVQNKIANYTVLSDNADTLWFQESDNDFLLYKAQYLAKEQ